MMPGCCFIFQGNYKFIEIPQTHSLFLLILNIYFGFEFQKIVRALTIDGRCENLNLSRNTQR